MAGKEGGDFFGEGLAVGGGKSNRGNGGELGGAEVGERFEGEGGFELTVFMGVGGGDEADGVATGGEFVAREEDEVLVTDFFGDAFPDHSAVDEDLKRVDLALEVDEELGGDFLEAEVAAEDEGLAVLPVALGSEAGGVEGWERPAGVAGDAVGAFPVGGMGLGVRRFFEERIELGEVD